MLEYGPEQASGIPLSPENAALVVARARRAILLRIPLSLVSAGIFLILASRSQGLIVYLWHLFFSLSLVAIILSVFSMVRHVKTLRTLPEDLERATAMNIPPQQFWEAHEGIFPLGLLRKRHDRQPPRS